MPADLYRTYQVLIEESVDPQHPKREKTAKNDNHNPGIPHALCVTNELFQDAVCYYTILLSGLAGNEKDGKRPLNPLWHEIADDNGKYKTAANTVVRRMSGKYKPLAGCETANNLCDKLLFECEAENTGSEGSQTAEQKLQMAADAYRIIQQQAVMSDDESGEDEGAKLNEFANNWASILCDPEGETLVPGTGVFDEIHGKLKGKSFAPGDVDRLLAAAFSSANAWLDAAGEAAHVKALQEKAQKRDAALAKAKTEQAKAKKHAEWATKIEALKTAKAENRAKFLAEYRANAAETIIGAINDGLKGDPKHYGIEKELFDEVQSEMKHLTVGAVGTPSPQRLRYGKNTNSFEAVLLRYWWVSSCASASARVKAAVWKAVELYITKKEPIKPPTLNGRPVTAMPYAAACRIAFPLFGKAMLDIPTKDRSPWWEFERAAFMHAADDVFKFKRRSAQREAKVNRLRIVQLTALEQAGTLELKSEDSPTGKKITVRGMKEDRRREKMEALLKQLGEERGLERAYGIDPGTIGDWASVRETLLKLEAQGILDEAELVAAVDECQTENSQGFGSADFFHELCDPDYHSIWSRVGEQTDAARANGIKDFVAYYARYSEWIEDLSELSNEGAGIKAISYTFPGTPNRFGKTSQRHFNFKARLSTRFVFPKLFTEASGVYSLIKTEEERAVTLSARRLKRDRILDSKGESAAALWCPPLVIADGDARPNAGKREGTALKMKDVSFSLMVEPRANDAKCEPPVHLNVQLPIESKQVGKLYKGQIFFGKGSLKGGYFRWPGDPESVAESGGDEAQKRTSPREVWCGDGTQDGFRIKKWTESDKGAWKGEPDVVPEFHVLSVDLGNRFCAAFARLRVHRDANDPKRGRTISPEHGWAKPIFAHVFERGILRLQGEDAMVWDHKRGPGGECLKSADGKYLYELQREPFGNDGRGRFPKTDEIERFRALAGRIVLMENLACRAEDKMTYPELGDHLLYRLKRRLSRTRALFKLRWFAHRDGLEKQNYEYIRQRDDKERAEKRAKVVEMLAQAAARPPRDEDEQPDSLYAELRGTLADGAEWATIIAPLEPEEQPSGKKRRRAPKKSNDKAEFRAQCAELVKGVTEPKWDALIERIESEIEKMMMGESATSVLIEQTTGWCLPLRGRHWHWRPDAKEPKLEQGAKNECPDHVPPLMGMRGLSMRRLEQVLNLRQLCQSYAKIERRWLQPRRGVNDIVIKRGEELHDPCPDLLKTSNDLREQRVYQTAHLILTEALGLELKNPAEVERDGKTKKELKSEMDLHGAYKPKIGKDGKPLPRCSVIVLEDLSRYRTSQERTRAENSRLMQWAHRKIIEKLTDMVAPFEIRIMLVDPAFSSRFDSRTGVAGIRVNEVGPGFDKEMPYAAWKKRLNKSGKRADLADRVSEMAKLFEDNSGYMGTLLLPVEGGKLFFAARADDGEGHQNADENAAINIGMRALAHPDRLEIFPRLRTVRLNDSVVRVSNRRGSFALAKSDVDRELTKRGAEAVAVEVVLPAAASGDEGSEESSEHPDYFAVLAGTAFHGLPVSEIHAPLPTNEINLPAFTAYARPLFLRKVQEACLERVRTINGQRLASAKEKKSNAQIEEDQIPMAGK